VVPQAFPTPNRSVCRRLGSWCRPRPTAASPKDNTCITPTLHPWHDAYTCCFPLCKVGVLFCFASPNLLVVGYRRDPRFGYSVQVSRFGLGLDAAAAWLRTPHAQLRKPPSPAAKPPTPHRSALLTLESSVTRCRGRQRFLRSAQQALLSPKV